MIYEELATDKMLGKVDSLKKQIAQNYVSLINLTIKMDICYCREKASRR